MSVHSKLWSPTIAPCGLVRQMSNRSMGFDTDDLALEADGRDDVQQAIACFEILSGQSISERPQQFTAVLTKQLPTHVIETLVAFAAHS